MKVALPLAALGITLLAVYDAGRHRAWAEAGLIVLLPGLGVLLWLLVFRPVRQRQAA